MLHGTKPTVLLVEADTSLRRLIALGLQYRGMYVIEVDSSTQLNALAEPLPQLLVLDIDSGVNSDWSMLAMVYEQPQLSTIPIVVLAWESLSLVKAGMYENSVEERVTFLSKPFDARTLHATVEQLLAMHTLYEVARMYEMPTTGRTVSAAPSIWPLLTAAGLMLAFIGLMGQLSLIIIGLLIVVVSLLWWTLGAKPERVALPV